MSLIRRKYLEFLLPNTIMVFALSISEFVDVFLVAWMLGSEAMSVVNLGEPLMMVASTVSVLFSVGGGTLYARLVGEYRQQDATRVFTVSVLVGFCIVSLLACLMMLFFQPLVTTLCVDNAETIACSSQYIRVLIFSLPLLAFTNILFGFLPAMGMPSLSSTLLISANVINLCLDVVYIKFIGMGVEGAALATVSGYSVALVAYVVMCLRKNTSTRFDRLTTSSSAQGIALHLCGFSLRDLGWIKKISQIGIPSSLGQLSFAIKFSFCNAMALYYGGQTALEILTVCLQLLSVATIFIGGIGSTFINIASFLKGQGDYQSIRRTGLLSYTLQLVCSIVYTALFCLFAKDIAELFSIASPDAVRLCSYAILVFSVCLIPRGLTLIFMFYVQMLGKVVYASTISLVDGFVGIVPVCYLLCLLCGLDGLWLSFGVVNMLLFVLVLSYNAFSCSRHPGRYSGILLFEKDENPDVKTLSWSRQLCGEEDVAELVKSVCEGHNCIDGNLITRYLCSLLKGRNKIFVDVIMHLKNDHPSLLNIRTSYRKLTDFCSMGSTDSSQSPGASGLLQLDEPKRIIQTALPENTSNIIALGMNCLQINIKAKE